MKNLFFLFSVAVFGLIFSSCQKEEIISSQIDNLPGNFASANADGNAGINGALLLNHTRLLVSSNTSGSIMDLSVINDEMNVTDLEYGTMYADADGIVYDMENDAVYQVNRSGNNVVAYGDFDLYEDGDDLSSTATSSSNFINGREATYSRNRLVVAQDASPDNGDQNAFVVYRVSPDQIQYSKTIQTDINLWGIQLSGTDMWAIVDNSNMLARFDKFNRAIDGSVLSPTESVMIEGIVRTHGLFYDADSDVMVLTDVGEAASANDGAIHYISDFSQKWNDAVNGSGAIAIEDQIRIAGPMSKLGNPVDVTYSDAAGQIFVAERANSGGRFLVFDVPTASGDMMPEQSMIVAGASAVTKAN
ncbi:MAG: hypothetical protein GYB31_07835 [Bacteroidetes bacterium]|nr:hypothetical protein [Bacteroidota bacterium]